MGAELGERLEPSPATYNRPTAMGDPTMPSKSTPPQLPAAFRKLFESGKSSMSARELHAALEVTQPFEEWFQEQVSTLGLREGVDYVSFDPDEVTS